ncbi:hypothetical protein QBC40DRAFT_264559 [Triangularia verruculosa]|uniref:C2H2-type domain-containing protein n=1 Tax=Triangularia verruculosa TaxID=2587418 RepID=A0AAN6XHS6_9PEZI|nr:hypothetical protein QBC40DRAFT_264559 [Triangularia verruculosa]
MENPTHSKADPGVLSTHHARDLTQQVRAKAPLAAHFEDCTQALQQLHSAINANPSVANLRDLAERCLSKLTSWGHDTGASSRRLDHALRWTKGPQQSTQLLLEGLHSLIAQATESLPPVVYEPDAFDALPQKDGSTTPLPSAFAASSEDQKTKPLPEAQDIQNMEEQQKTPQGLQNTENQEKIRVLQNTQELQKTQELLEILGLGDQEPDWDTERCLVDAEDILDDLADLRPTLLDPFDDMETEVPPDANRQEIVDRGYVNQFFPKAPIFLIERLVAANQRRRRYIWNLRQQTTDNVGEIWTTPPGVVTGGIGFLKPIFPKKPLGGSRIRRVRGYRKASTPSGSEINASRTTPSTTGRASYFSNPLFEQESVTSFPSIGMENDDDIQPPEPPVDITVEKNLPFQCQYCRFEVPLEPEKTKMKLDEWLAHLYLDMQPYMCTFDGCSKGHRLFGVKQEWFQHELDYHRTQQVWYCKSTACVTKFNSVSLLREHLISTHPDIVISSPEILELLLSTSQIPYIQPLPNPQRECPLCGIMYKESLVSWKDHLAGHLEQFALFSLGQDDAEYEVNGEEDEARQERVHDYVEHSQLYVISFQNDDSVQNEATTATIIPRSMMPDESNDLQSFNDSSGGEGRRGRIGAERAWIEAYIAGKAEGAQVLPYRPLEDDRLTIHETFDTNPINVPPRNAEFVGRDADLQLVNGYLSKSGHICVVSGRGGIGKTATAVEYAWRFAHNFETVIWVEAEDQGGLADKYNSVGAELFHQKPDNQDSTTYMLEIRTLLGRLERPWLLIFDNVEAWDDISRYIPRNLPKTKGSILITTREQTLIRMDASTDTFALERGLHRVELEPLTPDEAAEFLIGALDPDWATLGELSAHHHYKQAVYTAELVERLPLAVIMVAGYLKTSRATLDDFMEIWDEKKEFRATQKSRMAVTTEVDSSLDMLWEIGISELGVPARNLLEILAFLDPENIQKELLVGDHTEDYLAFLNATQATQYKRMIRALEGRKLIEVRSTGDGKESYRIHRLLQRKIIIDIGFQLKLDSAMRKATRLVRNRFPKAPAQQTPAPKNRKQCKEYMPHISSLHRAFLEGEKTFPEFERLEELADLFYDAGFYIWESKAEGHNGLELLDAAERIHDTKHPRTDPMAPRRADIHCISGLLRYAMGCQEREETRRRLELAKDIRKHVFVQSGTKDNDILLQNAATDYGLVLLNQYEFEDAERIFERCLEHYRSWDTEDKIPFEYSKYYYNMGVVRMCQERLEESIGFLQRSVELVEFEFGKDTQYWDNYFMLACAIRQAGTKDNYERSLAMHLEIREARLNSAGKHSKGAILSTFAVGGMYVLLNDLPKATMYLEECIELGITSNWMPEALGRARLHLACVYRRQGIKEQEANEMEQEAMSVLHDLSSHAARWFEGINEPLMTYDDLQATDEGRYISRMLLRLLWARRQGKKTLEFYLDLIGKRVTMKTGL